MVIVVGVIRFWVVKTVILNGSIINKGIIKEIEIKGDSGKPRKEYTIMNKLMI